MTLTTTSKKFLAALTGLALVSPASVSAIPTLRISDGINAPMVFADGFLGDLTPGISGAVVISSITYYNGWTVDLSTGYSKPFSGSATAPALSFYASALSSGAGSLTIQFSDDGFGPFFAGYSLSYGGETAETSSTAYKAYLDNTNTLFGGSVLASTVNTGSFGDTILGTFASPGPFSLTHEVTFTHTAAGVSSSISAQVQTVSVPDHGSTIAMLSSAILALGAARRKFRF